MRKERCYYCRHTCHLHKGLFLVERDRLHGQEGNSAGAPRHLHAGEEQAQKKDASIQAGKLFHRRRF
jgi:hypothetical protein